jgi:DNA-binding MarR family transcriptional regulator
VSPALTKALFGDVLALARESWIREMARRVARLGYHDYRRSDALALRWLVRGPFPLSTFTSALGVSRQAARKVVGGLVERDLALVNIDAGDSRRRIVQLTSRGRAYAGTVLEVLDSLNDELATKIDPDHLESTRFVLTFVKDNFGL